MSGPLVTSLGHAGLRIDAEGLRLLCDPWLSPGGAFLGSWFPFPDNAHLRTRAVLDCDWVAVSHEHLDHLDLALLAGLPAGVRVAIPRYPSSVMRERMRRAGVREVHEVGAWERLALNDRGDWLTVVPEQSPMCHDAAVLVVAGGRAVLHGNDARPTLAQVRRATALAGGDLDIMAVQMSGASWHPICYDYPPDTTARICAEKRLSKFRAVTRLVRGAAPRFVVPYAGPPCFLDAPLVRHNGWIPAPGIFPDQAQAAAWLRSHLPAQQVRQLMPGDVLDAASGAVRSEPRWAGFDICGLTSYLEDYGRRRAPEIAAVYAAHPEPGAGDGLGERFAAHFARLGELSPYFVQRIDMVVRFEVAGAAGGVWDVHLRPDRTRVDLRGRAATPHYRLALDARWLAPVLAGRIGWEDLLLSLRFGAHRDPDIYNDHLVGLLKHADAAAFTAVEEYETGRDPAQTVRIRAGGRTLDVSRYCPHAGEDLREGGLVHGGVLRCLGHNFDFDLADGSCLNARCDPLGVREVSVAD